MLFNNSNKSKQVGKNKKGAQIVEERITIPFLSALIAFIILFCLIVSFVSKSDTPEAVTTQGITAETTEMTTSEIAESTEAIEVTTLQ